MHNLDLYDTDELANEIKVAPRTLIRWRNERVGPPWIKVGHQVRYRRADVVEWLESQRRVPVREGAV